MARTLDGLKKLLGTDGDSIGDLFENANTVIHVSGSPTPTADMAYETALKLHQKGRNLVVYYAMSEQVQAVSSVYIYTNGKFTFVIGGIVQGTIEFDENGVVVNMG